MEPLHIVIFMLFNFCFCFYIRLKEKTSNYVREMLNKKKNTKKTRGVGTQESDLSVATDVGHGANVVAP